MVSEDELVDMVLEDDIDVVNKLLAMNDLDEVNKEESEDVDKLGDFICTKYKFSISLDLQVHVIICVAIGLKILLNTFVLSINKNLFLEGQIE